MSDRFKWDHAKGHVDPGKFWDIEEIKSLPYERESFNDSKQILDWSAQGHNPRTGMLYDMRHKSQPSTTDKLIEWANQQGLEYVGISYYKMVPGDNLPNHIDTYKAYKEIHKLDKRSKDIYRYIFLPEDRQPGHVLEVDGKLFDWRAGDYVAWRYDTPHIAANLGWTDRYSIQLTGVLREDQ